MSIKQMMSDFWKDTSGSLSVEAVLVFPLLIWAYTAMIVFWDGYKNELIVRKATYTVADTLSREQIPITQPYLDGLNDVFAWLSYTGDPTSIRVTVVSQGVDAFGNPEKTLEWSETSGSLTGYSDISEVESFLPLMGNGEELIMVESTMQYVPIMSVGGALPELQIENRTIVPVRFATQYCWESCN